MTTRKRRKRRIPLVSRGAASGVWYTRALMFTGSALGALAAIQLLGFDLSAGAEVARLKSPITMFLALMFSIAITAVVGSAIGFRLVSPSRRMSIASVLASGAVFGLLAFVSFLPLLQSIGVIAGAVVLVAGAAVIAFLGGLVLSRTAGVRR